METERIALSQLERERLRVLYEVKQKLLTQVEAAERLKVGSAYGPPITYALRTPNFPPWERNLLLTLYRSLRIIPIDHR